MNYELEQFPAEIRNDIVAIGDNNGVLSAERCHRICGQLSINIETLMVALLPVAASYSRAPISSFEVGAVACGSKSFSGGYPNLYLGANLEFKNQALCHSVHAEQAAVSNAWLHDEPTVISLATSAAPCGHCRQFLYEISGGKSFPILMPKTGIPFDLRTKKLTSVDLDELLPAAFGPLDLGCERLLMEQSFGTNRLKLIDDVSDDELVKQALTAANHSYAPYTQNYIGCAIQLSNGLICVGRYAENVAHNPGLPAVAAAISNMVMNDPENKTESIERVVLVEHSTKSSQKHITQILLAEINVNIDLEYLSATI